MVWWLCVRLINCASTFGQLCAFFCGNLLSEYSGLGKSIKKTIAIWSGSQGCIYLCCHDCSGTEIVLVWHEYDRGIVP